MHDQQVLVDKKGAKIESFGFYRNRMPMRSAKDKAIVAKVFVKLSEVDKIIKELSKLERSPVSSFANPERFEERKTQFQDKKDRR